MKLIRNIVIAGAIFLIVVSSLACGINFSNNYSSNDSLFNTPIVLITGFGPFDIYEINPSQLIVESLDGQNIEGAVIVGIILPVNFNESVEVITQAISDYNPLIVISTGLSPGRYKISVEKCGINLKWLPRNGSQWFIPQRLDSKGPFIHLSSLNTKDIVLKIRGAGIPSRQSFYAGLYVCNAVLYGTLDFIKEHEIPTKAGFIHVPLLSSQDPDGMDLETMIEAVKIAIKTNLRYN
jgi:pyroglutamyl-peptidase